MKEGISDPEKFVPNLLLNAKSLGIPYDGLKDMTLRTFDSVLIAYLEAEAEKGDAKKGGVRDASQSDIDSYFGKKKK